METTCKQQETIIFEALINSCLQRARFQSRDVHFTLLITYQWKQFVGLGCLHMSSKWKTYFHLHQLNTYPNMLHVCVHMYMFIKTSQKTVHICVCVNSVCLCVCVNCVCVCEQCVLECVGVNSVCVGVNMQCVCLCVCVNQKVCV